MAATTMTAERPTRLLPREHGAYGMLGVPLATALSLRVPTLGAAAFALAGVCAFLAHEPLLVLLDRRGARARRLGQIRARRIVTAMSALTMVALAIGLVSAPSARSPLLLVPALLAIVSGFIASFGKEKSAAGEILVAATLSSLAIPVALANGADVERASWIATVFAVGYSSTTLGVRHVIAYARRGDERNVGAALAGVLLVASSLLLFLSSNSFAPGFVPIALAPLMSVALALYVAPPSPRRLRQLGWLLILASVSTGALVRFMV